MGGGEDLYSLFGVLLVVLIISSISDYYLFSTCMLWKALGLSNSKRDDDDGSCSQ